MMKRWQVTILMGLMALGLISGGRALTATAAKTNNIGYSVAAKIPKNQIQKKQAYFDLRMQSGKTQTIKATLYNVTNRDIQVKTAIHTAYTNDNGIIEYVTPAKTFDPSLTLKMSQLTKINGPKTVTIPANGQKVVTATVKIPKTTFNGVILGGWFFKKVNSQVTGHVKGSMNIQNAYSYVIGLKYTLGRVPQPDLKLTAVKAGMQNYHRGIFPALQNPRAVIIPNLTVKSTISSNNSGKVVKKLTKKNVQIAPNSTFHEPMLLGKTRLQAGKYHLHLVASNSAHRWVFDRDFTISQDAAQKYNKASVDNDGINIIWFVVLGALGMLLLVLLVLWLIFFLKKRRQKQA